MISLTKLPMKGRRLVSNLNPQHADSHIALARTDIEGKCACLVLIHFCRAHI